MTTLYWLMSTSFKLNVIAIKPMRRNSINLLISLALMLIAGTLLILFGNTNAACLWIGVTLMGCGMSSTYPCMFGIMQQTVNVTPLLSSAATISFTLGEFSFPLLISLMMQENPGLLMWVVMFCAAGMIVVLLLVQLIRKQMVERIEKKINETIDEGQA